MNKLDQLIIKYGDFNINLENLFIWIHNKQFPEADDYWDGNWINVTILYEKLDSFVITSGSIIHLPELENWLKETKKLYKTLKGKAELNCIEPYIFVKLEATNLGHIELKINITPDHLHENHEYQYEIDQSYLKSLITDLENTLKRFNLKKN